ncbi:YqcI/YcgG family protein [Streptomyces sp. SID6673]|nr:YqcI/YcgG family protein [Streptomyces sp. SID11726]NEB26366.1 YqcI/YcgG family protein [Streptomyces sp. SID6673]
MVSDYARDVEQREYLRTVSMGQVPEWGYAPALELIDLIKSPDSGFPCTFAVRGAKTDSLRFGFIDELYDEGNWDTLRDLLSDYLSVYRSISRETSFLVFFNTDSEPDDLEGYFRTFWRMLQYLHDGDEVEWPGDVPRDGDDPLWEFSFGGTPIFVVCATPAHVKRRSRNSPVFLVTFQPRWVFENIGPETSVGRASRVMIRKRLQEFDGGMEMYGEMGDYGDPDSLEWKQYFLPDTNDPGAEISDVARCPFRPGPT